MIGNGDYERQKNWGDVIIKLLATSSKSTIQNLVSPNVAFLRQETSLHIVLTPDRVSPDELTLHPESSNKQYV